MDFKRKYEMLADAVSRIGNDTLREIVLDMDNTDFGSAAEKAEDIVINPFKEKTWNLTEQGRLKRDDPDQYELLRKKALADL